MVKVTAKIVLLLELAARHQELRFSDLLSETGLGRSNLSHLLRSLCDNGLLARRGHGRYILGDKWFSLFLCGDQVSLLQQIVSRCANNVMYEFDELAVVTARHNGQRLTLLKVRPQGKSHQVNGNEERYQRAGWYNTASGRMLLAFQDDEQIKHLVEECGLPSVKEWPEAATAELLQAEIRRTRQQKALAFAVDDDVRSIAVPVQDFSGDWSLCVSVAFLRALSKFSDLQIIERLRKHAEIMTKEIHFNRIVVSQLQLG